MTPSHLGYFAEKNAQCDHCHRSQAELQGPRLLVCGACRFSYYCSRECQKLDWKNHRQLCTFNQNAKKGIAKAIENGDTLGEIPIREIDRKFKRWHEAASPLLKTAAMEALEIHTSSECCLTHIVWITVASNLTAGTPKAATPSDAVKYFRVTDGCVCTIDTTPMDITADAREEIIRNQKKALELRESGAALGVLCMVIRLTGKTAIQQLLNWHLGPSFDARMVERNPLWLQELQFHIARGVGI